MLFGSDQTNVMASACLGWGGKPDTLYSEGYLIAARSLAEKVCATHTDQDLLVYPIVYLYRHHVELVLKRLTVIGAFLIGHELTGKQVKDLDKLQLHQLWPNFKPILQEVCEQCSGGPIPQEDIEGIDSYIKQLSEIDPTPQAFRYAVTKKGDPSLPSDLKIINIATFAGVPGSAGPLSGRHRRILPCHARPEKRNAG